MRFRLVADMAFYADNIDEALAMLSAHFTAIADGCDDKQKANSLDFIGSCRLEPIGQET